MQQQAFNLIKLDTIFYKIMQPFSITKSLKLTKTLQITLKIL